MKSLRMSPRWAARYGPPVLVFAGVVVAWEAYAAMDCARLHCASALARAKNAYHDRAALFRLARDPEYHLAALLAAVVGGVRLGCCLPRWKMVDAAFAFCQSCSSDPDRCHRALAFRLLLSKHTVAVLVCAFLVAFFPILSNTALGLAFGQTAISSISSSSIARRAGNRCLHLRLPAALPFFFGGLRIRAAA